MRSNYKVASRLLSLIDRVDSGRPIRLAEIAAEFDVDLRCASEYRDFVMEHRDLVEEREGRSKVWRKQPGPDACLAQAAALDFAVHALSELDGSEHLAELEAMAHQARLALGDVERIQLDRVTRNFQVRTSERTRNKTRGKWVRKLLAAQHERHVCRIQYEGLNGFVGPHEIEPWGLLLHRGRLLCVAGKRSVKRPHPVRRMYLLDGIQEVVTTRQRFHEPAAKHTDYAQIFKDSFGIYCNMPEEAVDVHLQVRGVPAMALRHRAVHPSQQLSEGENGTWNVTLHLVLCPEFMSFVLGMLPDVRVIAPQSLACKLQDTVDAWRDLSEFDK